MEVSAHCWGWESVPRGGTTCPGEIRLSRLDVEVQEVEHNTMRQVSKGAIIDHYALAGVNHLKSLADQTPPQTVLGTELQGTYLDIIQVRLFHGLKVRDFGGDAPEIVLHSIVGVPTDILQGVG